MIRTTKGLAHTVSCLNINYLHDYYSFRQLYCTKQFLGLESYYLTPINSILALNEYFLDYQRDTDIKRKLSLSSLLAW
jgi:hypothetical protein